jgi:1-aminocyclopropane-1-carboxylate deaminase
MELAELLRNTPVQRVHLPELEQRGVELALWRLDLIDAAAPGNKLFKLWENLRAARAQGYRRVLSCGGAFSNHIHALALTGAAAGFDTVGVIRGDSSSAANPTLSDAVEAGMTLHFVSREHYRQRDSAAFRAELEARFGPCYFIPEGGSNRLGALGCRIIGQQIAGWEQRPDLVALPCGTGATLAGVVAGLEDRCAALGVAVLKDGDFLHAAVRAQLQELDAAACMRWRIDTHNHGGGYAKVAPALRQFVTQFGQRTDIPLEPIYTGKMLYALYSAIERGEFAPGTRLLALHTGGLQGARGFEHRQQGFE